MVYRQWQTLWETQNDERTEAWLARWSGLSQESLNEWELEPEYGAFVDQDGRIVSGARQREAWLDSADPQKLTFNSDVRARIQAQPGAQVLFLDWGTQSRPWTELFDAWDGWETEGQILACGPIDVSFELASTWKAPAFIVFRSTLDHGLEAVTIAQDVPARAKPTSLLERAQALRDASSKAPASAEVPFEGGKAVDNGEPLPMLPFTLASLNDEDHAWPVGTATFGA